MAFLMEKLDPIDRRQKKDLKTILEAVPIEAPPLKQAKLEFLKKTQNISTEKQTIAAFDHVVTNMNKPKLKQQLLTSGVGTKGQELHHCKHNNTHHKATAGQKFIL